MDAAIWTFRCLACGCGLKPPLIRVGSLRCPECQRSHRPLDSALTPSLTSIQVLEMERAEREVERLAQKPGGGFRLLELLSRSGWAVRIQRGEPLTVFAEHIVRHERSAKLESLELRGSGETLAQAASALVRAAVWLAEHRRQWDGAFRP